MIGRLVIHAPDRAILPWWSKVPWLHGKSEIAFTPGINVLFGPNGSGKSAVLRTIARLTFCEQGGFSALTETSIRAYVRIDKEALPDGIGIETDGQPVRYADPSQRVGVVGGGFDNDFFDEGFHEAIARESAGQAVIRRLTRVIGPPPPSQIRDVVGKGVNDIWLKAKERALLNLEPRIPKGPATVLLDEPDRSMDLPLQEMFYREVLPRSLKRNIQVILATHNPFALLLPEANWIETQPGYLETCRSAVLRLGADLAGSSRTQP